MPADRLDRRWYARRMLLVAAVVATAALLAIWRLWPAPSITDADDAALVAEGRVVYGQQCASCHGAQLEGQANWRRRLPSGRLPAPPHDVSGHTWHHPDTVLFGMVKHGLGPYAPPGYESDMPGFADTLTDRQIRAVLAFIKSTWPAEIRSRQQRMTEPPP